MHAYHHLYAQMAALVAAPRCVRCIPVRDS
jgi:hypothetical protein